MDKKRLENCINNSYQMEREFKEANTKRTPIPRKSKYPTPKEKNGPCKVLSEEEVFLYKLQHYNSPFKF